MFLLWWLCADNYTQPSWVSYVPCPWSRTVFQPMHFAPLDHRRWQNYRHAVVELYPHCSVFTFQGTPVPTFQLGPRTPPTILDWVLMKPGQDFSPGSPPHWTASTRQGFSALRSPLILAFQDTRCDAGLKLPPAVSGAVRLLCR